MYAPMSTRHEPVLGTEQRRRGTGPGAGVAASGRRGARRSVGRTSTSNRRRLRRNDSRATWSITYGSDVGWSGTVRKSRERRVERRVRAQRTERDTDRGPLPPPGRRRGTIESSRIRPARSSPWSAATRDTDPAAHAVRHDDRRCGQAGVLGDRDRPRAPTCPCRSGHAGHCHRGPERSSATTQYSPASSGATWSHQPECAAPPWTSTRPGRVGRTPTPVVDRHAVDLGLGVLRQCGERVEEPLRRVPPSAQLVSASSALVMRCNVSTYSSMMSNTTSRAGRTRSTRPMI